MQTTLRTYPSPPLCAGLVPTLVPMLVLLMAAAGCSTSGEKGRKKEAQKSAQKNSAQKEKQGTDKEEASAQAPEEAVAKTAKGGPWRQSLGKIAHVNEAMGFVLVDIGTAPSPEAGASLQSYTDSIPSAQLVVSTYQRRPFLIADVVSGMPRVGDSMALMPKKASPAVPRVSSGEEPLSEPPLPRRQAVRSFSDASQIPIPPLEPIRPNPPRPSPPVVDGAFAPANKAPRTAGEISTPQAAPTASPANAAPSSTGAAIIPGIPLSRKRSGSEAPSE